MPAIHTTQRAQKLHRLLSDYLSDENRIQKHMTFILQSILDNALLKDPEPQQDRDLEAVQRKWIARVNTLLQSKDISTRWSAVVFVKTTSEQSPILFANNFQTWAGLLSNIVSRNEPALVLKAAIETLSLLFSYSAKSKLPDLQGDVVHKMLIKFNQTLVALTRKDDVKVEAFNALALNVEYFPTVSRHLADQITKACVTCLEGSECSNFSPAVEAAAHCLAKSSLVGGRKDSAALWNEKLMCLIGSIHLAANTLFDSIDEDDVPQDIKHKFPLSPTSRDHVESFPILFNRIIALQVAIITFLSTRMSMIVNVPTVAIIQLICRFLNIYEGIPMREFKNKEEYIWVMTCLPALQASTCKLFAAVLHCSSNALPQYTRLFASILSKLLSEKYQQRPLRISIYKLTTLCLQIYGAAFGQSIFKPAMAAILNDLKDHTKSIFPATRAVKAGTKRHADADTVSNSMSSLNSVDSEACDIQVAALDLLRELLVARSLLFDKKTRAHVDQLIISKLLNFTQAARQFKEQSAHLKRKLYECLLATVMNPSLSQASVLPYAIRMFSAGVNEENQELKSLCSHSLAVCELLMHPRMPPMQRAIPAMPADQQYQDDIVAAPETEPDAAEEQKNEQRVQEETVQEHAITDTRYEEPSAQTVSPPAKRRRSNEEAKQVVAPAKTLSASGAILSPVYHGEKTIFIEETVVKASIARPISNETPQQTEKVEEKEREDSTTDDIFTTSETLSSVPQSTDMGNRQVSYMDISGDEDRRGKQLTPDFLDEILRYPSETTASTSNAGEQSMSMGTMTRSETTSRTTTEVTETSLSQANFTAEQNDNNDNGDEDDLEIPDIDMAGPDDDDED